MNKRKFGQTDLMVSEIGFGAWGIGGPAMVGETAIGWGEVDDRISMPALEKAVDVGINFFDTADIYGLGHSETLIGKVFRNRQDVIIATKVGHRIQNNRQISLDYSKNHILSACDQSLKRLQRETIDYYQLHSAKIQHLEAGECLEAMEQLQQVGKIRYWGISLNTYNPYPEGDFMLNHHLGHGFQVAFNILNQRALALIRQAHAAGLGIIARMPLQFGLLTGKFTPETRFAANDHRHFRLKSHVLKRALTELEAVWTLSEKYGISKTTLSLSFIASFSEISTIIPGIKTPAQAIMNTSDLRQLAAADQQYLIDLFEERLSELLDFMQEEEF